MTKTFWGNTGHDYVVALSVFVSAIIIFLIFHHLILGKLKKVSPKTKTEVDDFLVDMLKHIRPPFYYFISFYIASGFLTMPGVVSRFIYIAFIVVVILEVILAVQRVINFTVNKKLMAAGGDEEGRETIVKLSGSIIKGVVWTLGILMIFSNLGVNVTSLIAGLGIGGIAVALALQNILGDMFASFSIFIDKPFKEGDFITVGSDMGTVSKIGIKSTRLITLEGQELVIPNKTLMEERINNYGKMKRRRVSFSLGVTYGTSFESLEKIPEIVADIIKQQKNVEFGRAHFKSYGESSLDFEVVYFIKSADYDRYMDIQQAINLEIFRRFQTEKIEFAFPTRTVYIEKQG